MIFLLIFIATFFAVAALFFVIASLKSSSAKLQRRLAELEKGETELQGGGLLREADSQRQQLFARLPVLRGLKRLIVHSGVAVTPAKAILYAAAAAATSAAPVIFLGRPGLAAVAAALTAFAPLIYLENRKRCRKGKFEEQLPDTLTMVARSLRAGHSLAAAMELVGQEQPEPTSSLFRVAFEQQQLGLKTADALAVIPERMDSADFHFFITIIRVNSETGGNLAEVLEKLAETIRARLQIRRQVQTYTAEGRVSGYILLLLPLVVFLCFYAKNPKYMQVFFDQRTCQLSLLAAVAAQVAGYLMIQRIVNIRI